MSGKIAKVWRPMTAEERTLALALRDYCFTVDKLSFLRRRFVKAMALRAAEDSPITDKQGNLIQQMAGWYGIDADARAVSEIGHSSPGAVGVGRGLDKRSGRVDARQRSGARGAL
jgi:hypothetical protein